MADTTTETYSLTKPEVGASSDTWGTKLNANLDTLDDLLDGTTAIAPKITQLKQSYAAVTSTSNAVDIDTSTGSYFLHVLTEATTFTFSNPPSTGTAYEMTLEVIQDSSASAFAVTWPASVTWPAGTAPTLTTTTDAVDVFAFFTRDGGTTWRGFVRGQDMG